MTVLFVDDEKQILRGIERMLEIAEVDWEAEFAIDANVALNLIEENSDIDTVVTDMKMPGMDGAQLLNQIAVTHPHLVRIVFSGQADREAAMRAVNPMHQYLAKPCEAQKLRVTIHRAVELRNLLHCDRLLNLVNGITDLPSLPTVYRQVVKELQSEDSSLESIGEIISQDAAMTAKILQICNSAVFGLKNPVRTAAQAAMLLGTETIKSLVLSVGVFQEFEGADISGFSIDALMDHSLSVAHFGKKMAAFEKLEKDMVDSAFTAGVLHDLGKLVLLTTDPGSFSEAVKKANTDGVPSWQAEQEIFGVDHAAVGAYLLSIWGIPQPIVEAVGLHHKLADSGESMFSILAAVGLSNEIVRSETSNNTERTRDMLGYVKQIDCDEKLSDWKALISDGP